MAISKVWIDDSCTACGICVDTAPDVFEVNDICVVKDNADLAANEAAIIQAAEECPCESIKYE